MPKKPLNLGEILVKRNLITQQQLDAAEELRKKEGKRLGLVLVEMELLTEQEFVSIFSKELKIDSINLSEYEIDPIAAKIIPEHICRDNDLIGIKKDDNKITVAMTDPLNILAIDDIQLMTGLIVKPVIATPTDVEAAIQKHFGKEDLSVLPCSKDPLYLITLLIRNARDFIERGDQEAAIPFLKKANQILDTMVSLIKEPPTLAGHEVDLELAGRFPRYHFWSDFLFPICIEDGKVVVAFARDMGVLSGKPGARSELENKLQSIADLEGCEDCIAIPVSAEELLSIICATLYNSTPLSKDDQERVDKLVNQAGY